MIDLTQLSQKQRWGLQYSLKLVNDAAESAFKPAQEGDVFTPKTEQAYADEIFKSWCNSYYQQLIKYKTDSALAMFNAMSEEQQAALVAQLGIPDVL